MKVAYLLRGKPDHRYRIARVPDHPPHVIIEAPADGVYTPAQLAQVADVDALLVSNGPVNAQVLAAAKNLKIVQRTGAGTDVLDLEAITRRGVPACNNRGTNSRRVADFYLAYLLNLMRRAPWLYAHTAALRWDEARLAAQQGLELEGKRLGIVGMGAIGFQLARRAHACDMEIVYHNRRPAPSEQAVAARRLPLDELLGTADAVAVCAPLTEETRGMIDARALALMKPSAYLICCARGGIVDEAALREALEAGRLAGAGIDNYTHEPLLPDNPLVGAPNALLSAHNASTVADGSMRSLLWALENVRAYVEDGVRPRNVLNGL